MASAGCAPAKAHSYFELGDLPVLPDERDDLRDALKTSRMAVTTSSGLSK